MKSHSHKEYPKDVTHSTTIETLSISPSGSYSRSNRRTASSKIQQLYPWLLFASTAVAAAFCFAYITKPVIISNSPTSILSEKIASNLSQEKQTQSNKNLPVDSPKELTKSSEKFTPSAPNTQGFEETNIRMQHILDAESSSGDIHRLVIDVPVVYKSRNLRWSQEETTQARLMLKRLEEYQQKTRDLRDEGQQLLDNWNVLMDASIPNQSLRADSPSLSANQGNPVRSVNGNNSGTIKIQPEKE